MPLFQATLLGTNINRIVLSLTSDPTRHRPNVDPLEPVIGKKPKIAIRSKSDAHAIDPNCVSYHASIKAIDQSASYMRQILV